MKEINCSELKEKINKKENLFLVDVREVFEYEEKNIGGINVPTSEIQDKYFQIPKDKTVIVYCRSGARSAMVIDFLSKNFGYQNLVNLKNGVIFCAINFQK